jgi:subtilase family serine protease
VPVTVSKTGSADAGPFQVRITFDPGQSVVVVRDFPGLAAGASETFNAQTPPGGNCFDPDCRICAVADSSATVSESNETNNELCRERQG